MKVFHALSLSLVLWAGLAQGHPPTNFGLGGHSTGRVGGGTADPATPFAGWVNPALLAGAKRGFQVSASSGGATYDPLGEIRLDGAAYRAGDGRDLFGEGSIPTRSQTLWTIGYEAPFRLGNHRGGLGMVTSGPLRDVRKFVARTPYDFTNLRYGDAEGQLRGIMAAGFEAIPGVVAIGVGLNLYLSTAGVSDLTLVGKDPTGRMSLDVTLNSSTVGGIWVQAGRSRLGLVYREKVAPDFQQKFSGRVQLGGDPVLAQPVLVQSSLYFEPATWELEYQLNGEAWRLAWGLEYQQWNEYEPPFLIASSVDTSGNLVQTNAPPLALRAVLSPRVSGMWDVAPQWTVGAGYSYRPSPVEDLSGPTNLVDTDAHALGLSLSYGWGPWSLTLAGQHHVFEGRTVVKDDGTYIGAPGYTVSGSATAVGLSLRTPL